MNALRTSGPWHPNRCWSVAAVALLAALGTTIPAGDGIEPELDLQLQQELDHLVGQYASGLDANQRLVASRKYAHVDGGYIAYAVVDTAGPQSLQTERGTIKLTTDNGKKWSVEEPVLEESFERFRRELPEASRFYRFDAIQLSRDGLSLNGSGGRLAAYLVQDDVTRFVFTADGLSYSYLPPEYAGDPHNLYSVMQSNWKEQLVFEPQLVEVTCDPTSCTQILSSIDGLSEIERGGMDPTLANYHDRKAEETRARRASNPFSDFELPPEEGSTTVRVSVKRVGAEHWIHLEQDSREGHEVRFRVDKLGTLYGYPSAEASTADDSLSIERRDDRDGALFDLVGLRGTVEVAVLEPEILQADLVYTLKTKTDLDAVPFSLETFEIGLTPEKRATVEIHELDDGNGTPLSWVRLEAASGVVLLPERVPAGTELTIHLEFLTRGSIYKVNSSYSYVARSGWLPFVRYTDKIEVFDLTVRTPAKYTTIGIGTKAAEERDGNIAITRWVANLVHFPTLIFGVYQEDAPKTEATKIDGTPIPVRVYVDKNSMTEWGIGPPQLRAPGTIAVNALNVYRELFGVDYPYGKLDLVNDPSTATGAQAPASIVYLGSAIFRSEAALGDAYAEDMTSIVERTIAHEVAHQWWGSLIGPANMRSYWFVESLAEYSAALFMEVVEGEGYQKPEKGRAAYLSMVRRWNDEILDSTLFATVQDSTTLWSNDGRTAAIYARGPYAFHMLREIFGDEKFFAFLKSVATELRGREIVSRDIQQVAERALGGTNSAGERYSVDLEWFFDQWIRGVGVPEYAFRYSETRNEDGSFRIDGTIAQRVFVGKHPVSLDDVFYRGVVPLAVLGKDKQRYVKKLVVEGRETQFALQVPVKPLEIELNPDGAILARPVRVE